MRKYGFKGLFLSLIFFLAFAVHSQDSGEVRKVNIAFSDNTFLVVSGFNLACRELLTSNDKRNSEFYLRPGLSGTGYSFESVVHHHYFLLKDRSTLVLSYRKRSKYFKLNTSFLLTPVTSGGWRIAIAGSLNKAMGRLGNRIVFASAEALPPILLFDSNSDGGPGSIIGDLSDQKGELIEKSAKQESRTASPEPYTDKRESKPAPSKKESGFFSKVTDVLEKGMKIAESLIPVNQNLEMVDDSHIDEDFYIREWRSGHTGISVLKDGWVSSRGGQKGQWKFYRGCVIIFWNGNGRSILKKHDRECEYLCFASKTPLDGQPDSTERLVAAASFHLAPAGNKIENSNNLDHAEARGIPLGKNASTAEKEQQNVEPSRTSEPILPPSTSFPDKWLKIKEADFRNMYSHQNTADVSMAMALFKQLYAPMDEADRQNLRAVFAPYFQFSSAEGSRYLRKLIPQLYKAIMIKAMMSTEIEGYGEAAGMALFAVENGDKYLAEKASVKLLMHRSHIRYYLHMIDPIQKLMDSIKPPPDPIQLHRGKVKEFRKELAEIKKLTKEKESGPKADSASDYYSRFSPQKKPPKPFDLRGFSIRLRPAKIYYSASEKVYRRELEEVEPGFVISVQGIKKGVSRWEIKSDFPLGKWKHNVSVSSNAISGKSKFERRHVNTEVIEENYYTYSIKFSNDHSRVIRATFDWKRNALNNQGVMGFVKHISFSLNNLPVHPGVNSTLPGCDTLYSCDLRSRRGENIKSHVSDFKIDKSYGKLKLKHVDYNGDSRAGVDVCGSGQFYPLPETESSREEGPPEIDPDRFNSRETGIQFYKDNIKWIQLDLDSYQKMLARARTDRQRADIRYWVMCKESDLQGEKDKLNALLTGKFSHTPTRWDGYCSEVSRRQFVTMVRKMRMKQKRVEWVENKVKDFEDQHDWKTGRWVKKKLEAVLNSGDEKELIKLQKIVSDRYQANEEAVQASEMEKAAFASLGYDIASNINTAADAGMMFSSAFVPGGSYIYASYAGISKGIQDGPKAGLLTAVSSIHSAGIVFVNAYEGYEQEGLKGAAKGAGYAFAVLGSCKVALKLAARTASGIKIGFAKAVDVVRHRQERKMGESLAKGFQDDVMKLKRFIKSGNKAAIRMQSQVVKEKAAAIMASPHAKNFLKKKGEKVVQTYYNHYSNRICNEVEEKFVERMRQKGWSKFEVQSFRNASSKGSVGMDWDLGLVEHPPTLNPETGFFDSGKCLTFRGKRASPYAWEKDGKEVMSAVFKEVTGHSADNAFVNVTSSANPEAFRDLIVLSDPTEASKYWAEMTSGTIQFKFDHMANAKGPLISETGKLQEASRGMAKEIKSKLIPILKKTAQNVPRRQSRMLKMIKNYKKIKTVFEKFGDNSIDRVEADRAIREITGKGLIETGSMTSKAIEAAIKFK